MQPHPQHSQHAQDTETHPHVCGTCLSDLVQPVEWATVGASYWQITLRCPECEWSGTGVFSEETVGRFQEVLDAGQQAMICDMLTLAESSFADEVDAFAAALLAGHILPEDF
jgi:hypothetical protein